MSYSNKKHLINFLETQLKDFPRKSYFRIIRQFRMINAADWQIKRKANNDHKLLYIISGGGFYNIQGNREEFKRGKIIFVGSGCQHYGRPDQANPPSFITIRFTTAPQHDHKLGIYGATTVSDPDSVEKLFCSLADAASLEASGLSEFHLSDSLLYQILMIMHRDLSRDKENRIPTGISSAVDMMNRHPESFYPVATLAKTAGMNERYFAVKFKAVTGLSPTSYMVRLRMSYANNLLASGKLTVQEVADRLGYSDAFVFSKQFKKQYGYSPGKAKYK